MNVLLVLLITILLFWLAYRLYGDFINHLFGSSDSNITPACSISDCRDYVPSKGLVLFSHHFSSIAGGGPIIGPTIALLYGFYPSWLWILIGAVFFGAVHDMTSLFVSLRERGRTIADITHRTLGKSGYILFILFVIFMVILVTSAFLGLTTTALTSTTSPDIIGLTQDQGILKTFVDSSGKSKVRIGGIASTSVIIITLLSPLIGYLLYRKGIRVSVASLISIIIMVLSVVAGLLYPVTIKPELWMMIITVYVFFAAGLPVWLILQPRDFINSFILYAGIAVLIMGLFGGGIIQGLTVNYPSFNIPEGNTKIGLLWPILFITIACGAISGFHSLIASGTTSKQLARESDAKRIGFGAMLLEGLLAVTVLIVISSCLDFNYYRELVFPPTSSGKSNPVLAFSLSMGKMLSMTGLPVYIGTIFGILMIEGFLVTTLDTAVRLNRYLFEELWQILIKNPPAIVRSYLFNAGLSVFLMFLFAYKQTFLSIWPVFGSANQLLAALSLLTVSTWLIKNGKRPFFTLLPALFMLITTIASLLYLLKTKYIPSGNSLLATFATVLILLSTGLILITVKKMNGMKKKRATKLFDLAAK